MAQSQMQPRFQGILSKKIGDAERPKPLPQGTYVFTTKGIPRADLSTQKHTPFYEFTCIPQGPAKRLNDDNEEVNLDVDQELLDEALTRKDGSQITIQTKAMRLTYYVTPDAEWRLHEFLQHLGFSEGEDPNVAVQESMNRQFLGYVQHKPSDDGQTMYANITRTAPIED